MRRRCGLLENDVLISTQLALLSQGNMNGLDGPVHTHANVGASDAIQLSHETF